MHEVEFIPDQDAIDFIVYVCSSIGIWFGISLFTILSASEKVIINRITRRYSSTQDIDPKEVQSTTYFIIRDCDIVLRSRVRTVFKELHQLRNEFKRNNARVKLELQQKMPIERT